MDHPRSKLPAVLAVLFCIALLGGVGVLLWKTLPEKQQPQQAETIQTDSVFSSEQTAVEPEREAPYEGELPEQAEAAQPEQPDSEQPSEPAADPAAPDDTPVTDAQKTAQATLASMTEDEKLWQLFFVTPEAITNVNTATVAGEATKNALAQYPVGGIVYFAKNLEDRAQAALLASDHGRKIGVINIAAFHIDIHLAIHTPSGRKSPFPSVRGHCHSPTRGRNLYGGLQLSPSFLPPVHRMLRTDAACFS